MRLLYSLSVLVCAFCFFLSSAAAETPRSLIFEGSAGVNACSGDFCSEGGPSVGIGFTGMYRMHPNFALGLNVHYGRFDADNLDLMYDYVVNFEARGILPLGSRLRLFGGGNFGYVTTYAEGVFDEDDDVFRIFRATGVTFGVHAGLSVRLTERIHAGVLARFWVPVWSDACFYEADGGECREPHELEFDFDMLPWFAGVFLQYELPY